MTGWMIFGGVLLLLCLLALVRLGAEVTYAQNGLTVRVRLGQFHLTLLPRKKKAHKKKRTPKSKGKKNTDSKPKQAKRTGEKSGGNPAENASATDKTQETKKTEETSRRGGLPLPLMDLISLALDAAGALFARLQLDDLTIEYTIAGKEDPAGAAIQFGMICAGGGALVPVLENSFYCVKQREIRANVDFDTDTPLIWLRLALSIRLGQLAVIAGRIGWRFFKLYRQNQEGNDNGTEASDQ